MASCQVAAAGGADGGAICSAAGGFANGDGTIGFDEPEAVGAVAEVGVIVGADVGMSGGIRGTMLVGFKIWALWTVELPVGLTDWAPVLDFAWWMWQARAEPGTPPRPKTNRAANLMDQPKPIRWPRPCDAIMGFAILFLRGRTKKRPGPLVPSDPFEGTQGRNRGRSTTRNAVTTACPDQEPFQMGEITEGEYRLLIEIRPPVKHNPSADARLVPGDHDRRANAKNLKFRRPRSNHLIRRRPSVRATHR